MEQVSMFAARTVSAVGILMVGFLTVVSGVIYIDLVTGLFDVHLSDYHLCRLVICGVLIVCAGITLSKGVLTSGIIMVVTAVSCLTFVLSYMFGFDPSDFQDPILSILLYACALVLFKSGDYLMGSATLVYAVSLTSEMFLHGNAASAIIGSGLFAAGVMYTICATTAIVQNECGVVRWKLGSLFEDIGARGIAQNPYERSVPMTSITAGMMFVFMAIVTFGDRLYIGDMFTLAVISGIVFGVSVYMCAKKIIAEGMLFLFMAIINLLSYVPPFFGLEQIPSAFITVMLLPVLAVTALCARTRDVTLGIAAGAFALNLLLTSIVYMSNGEYYVSNYMQVLWAVSGVALLYHGVSRWLLVCTRREIIPLLSGNIVMSERAAEPTTKRSREKLNSDMIIYTGFLLMAVLLLWNGLYYLCKAFGIFEQSTNDVCMIKCLLSVILLLFSIVTIRRGLISESLLFILTAVSCLDFAIMTLAGENGSDQVDAIFGVFLVLCGTLFAARGNYVIGAATIVYAVGTIAAIVLEPQGQAVLVGINQLVAGSLFAADSLYRLGWGLFGIDKKLVGAGNRSFNVRETVATLGYLNLAIVLLTMNLLTDADDMAVCIMIHSFIIISLGLYAIYNGVFAEGMLILVPTMLTLMVYMSMTFVYGDVPLPVYLFTAYIMLCPLAIFLHRRNIVCAVMALAVAVEAVLMSFIDDQMVYVVTAIPFIIMVVYAVRNWIFVEKRVPKLPDE